MSSTIYLECIDGKSNKFYELILNGNDVTSRYGPCGKPGVTGVKTFDSNAEAKKFFDKTVAEKKKKGYNVAKGTEEAPEEKPAKKNSKKRGAEDEEESKPKKVAKTISFLDSLVDEITSELQAKDAAQKAEAKEKEWTYDPRPAVDVTRITLAQILNRVNGYNAATIDAIATAVKKTVKEDGDGVLAQFLSQVADELGSSDLFNENQVQILAVHRFLEETLLKDFLQVKQEEGDDSFTTAKDSKGLLAAFKSHLSMESVLEKFPVLPARQVDEAERIPDEIADSDNEDDEDDDDDEDEDKEEEENDWWSRFTRHMLFLYDHLDKHNCHSFGRILAAFQKADETFEKYCSLIEEESEDEDNEDLKEFLSFIKKKYSIGKGMAKLSKAQLCALAVREIFKEPLGCRTLFGSFCFNVRETDYSGNKSGIADYVIRETINDYYNQTKNCVQFVYKCLILGKTDDVDNLVITAATYIPGMKDPLDEPLEIEYEEMNEEETD